MRPARSIVPVFVSSVLGLSLTAFAATRPPAATPIPATQTGSGPPPLTTLVMTGKGYIKENVRKSVRDSDTILSVNWPYMAGGPHLCTFYSCGNINVDPSKFMSQIMRDPSTVISIENPLDEVPEVARGSTYESLIGHVPLVVSAVSPCCFMLTDSSHKRAGSVTYGAFQDASGELWVYEECIGSYYTSSSEFVGMHSEKMVPSTRKVFQALITAYFPTGSSAPSGSAPCPAKYASNFEVGVNHHVDTGIKVAKGDKITIRASGEVTFGIMAGSGGPEGIDFLPSYNYFAELKHGCLIGRIHSVDADDPWSYIGESADFTADRSGLLEFNVNDNDPDNNVGEFKVEITVCKQR